MTHEPYNEINIKFPGKMFCTSFILGSGVLFYPWKENYGKEDYGKEGYGKTSGDGSLFRLYRNFMWTTLGKYKNSHPLLSRCNIHPIVVLTAWS